VSADSIKAAGRVRGLPAGLHSSSGRAYLDYAPGSGCRRPRNILFTWSGVQNGVSYRFQSSPTTDFSSMVENQTTVMTAWSPTFRYTVGNYYWRVAVSTPRATSSTLRVSLLHGDSPGPQAPQRTTRSRRHGCSTPATASARWRLQLARGPHLPGDGGVVPPTASAVTGNLTVTGQSSSGFLYVGPVAANNPTSSNLNFPVGDDRANAVTVALGGEAP